MVRTPLCDKTSGWDERRWELAKPACWLAQRATYSWLLGSWRACAPNSFFPFAIHATHLSVIDRQARTSTAYGLNGCATSTISHQRPDASRFQSRTYAPANGVGAVIPNVP